MVHWASALSGHRCPQKCLFVQGLEGLTELVDADVHRDIPLFFFVRYSLKFICSGKKGVSQPVPVLL